MSGEKPIDSAGGARVPSTKIRPKNGKRGPVGLPNAARGIDDPNPWRVDRQLPKVIEIAERHNLVENEFFGLDSHGLKNSLREIAVDGYLYRNRWNKHEWVQSYLNKRQRYYFNNIKKIELLFNKLIDMGPIHLCGMEFTHKNDASIDFPFFDEDNFHFQRLERIKEEFGDFIKDIDFPKKKRQVSNKMDTYYATSAMITAVRGIGFGLALPRELSLEILEDAWLDAGLPDISAKAARNGQTLGLWLRKHLKKFNF